MISVPSPFHAHPFASVPGRQHTVSGLPIRQAQCGLPRVEIAEMPRRIHPANGCGIDAVPYRAYRTHWLQSAESVTFAAGIRGPLKSRP